MANNCILQLEPCNFATHNLYTFSDIVITNCNMQYGGSAMNKEKRTKTAISGLLVALCIILLMAQNTWAQAENNNPRKVVILDQNHTSDLVTPQGPDNGNHGANTSQTIVLEIEDARTLGSHSQFLSMVLIILLLIVFSLLLVHILMHHTREDGETATTPAPSLLGVDPNPIEDRQPRKEVCEEESFPMPLALSVLEASVQDCGPGASTRVPSMGYPVGHLDLGLWGEFAGEEDVPEGVLS